MHIKSCWKKGHIFDMFDWNITRLRIKGGKMKYNIINWLQMKKTYI